MTIQEAIISGEPFKLPEESNQSYRIAVIKKGDRIRWRTRIHGLSDTVVLTPKEILRTDWELKP